MGFVYKEKITIKRSMEMEHDWIISSKCILREG